MRYAAAIFALVVVPMPAAATEVCAALERLEVAAREPEPFASTGRALAGGEVVVPGFRATDCSVRAGELWCRVTGFASSPFGGWGQPLGCEGLVDPELSHVRRERVWLHVYVLGGLRFQYGISCYGCAGGTVSYFTARPTMIASGHKAG